MKTLKLTLASLLIFMLPFISSVNAQDYCTYDDQTAYDFGVGSNDVPYNLLEQADGKIIMTGTSYYSSGNYFTASIARLNTNNIPDASFGNNGRVGHRWDSRNTCISSALQEEGKILLGGYQAPGNGISSFRPYVARLLSDGSPDSSFGLNGSAKLEFSPGIKGSVVGIKETEDGKTQAIIIGDNPPGVGVVQLDEFGIYDTTFSGDGVAYHNVLSVYWQTDYGDGLFMDDGSVIIITKAYTGITKPCITKLTTEGELDSTFAFNGTLYIERSIMYNYAGIHAALTTDEDIIIAATSEESPKKYLLFKVNGITGELDNDFGTNGILESSQTASFNSVHDVVIDPGSGGLYALGTGGTNNWISTVWKVSATGQEENSCGGSSMQNFTLSNPYSSGYHAGLFTSTGDFRIMGITGIVDETSGDNQGNNFMIPKNSTATFIDEKTENALRVYPNPAQSEINISIEDHNVIYVVNIYNQMGQIVQSQEEINMKSKMDISALPDGIYILELKSTKTTLRKKIIVN